MQRTQGMHHKKRAEVSYKYVCKSRAVHLLVLHEGAASRLDTSPGERGRLGHTHSLSLFPPPPSTEGKGNRAQNTQTIVKGSLVQGMNHNQPVNNADLRTRPLA